MVLSYAGGIDILSTPSPQFHTSLPKLKHVKQAFIFQLFRLFRSLTSFSLRFCCLLPSFALFLLSFRSLIFNAFFIVFSSLSFFYMHSLSFIFLRSHWTSVSKYFLSKWIWPLICLLLHPHYSSSSSIFINKSVEIYVILLYTVDKVYCPIVNNFN